MILCHRCSLFCSPGIERAVGQVFQSAVRWQVRRPVTATDPHKIPHSPFCGRDRGPMLPSMGKLGRPRRQSRYQERRQRRKQFHRLSIQWPAGRNSMCLRQALQEVDTLVDRASCSMDRHGSLHPFSRAGHTYFKLESTRHRCPSCLFHATTTHPIQFSPGPSALFFG